MGCHLPDITLSEVRQLAGRLGRAVRETPITLSNPGEDIHVTVSIGATLVHPGRTGHDLHAEALIDQADQALYNSKSGGRDTVTVTMRDAA